jgi:hypothetical protein
MANLRKLSITLDLCWLINYDQCTDFRRAMKNKDQDDTDSNKSCQEWIRDLEADLEESKNQPKEPLEMI